ncbi:hypothetical protein N9Z01_01395 [Flavobacteriaceae bacterium]|nr:hypothetical protein [Flavobacteriaceae bacterium]
MILKFTNRFDDKNKRIHGSLFATNVFLDRSPKIMRFSSAVIAMTSKLIFNSKSEE